jgi:CDP-paratose 2-epimerase
MAARAVVTGGAGFIGCHLVNNLLRDGCNVIIFDALTRPGSERNLAWLHGEPRKGTLQCVVGDVRNSRAVREVTSDADVIYHLAGQVAVTSSMEDPRLDFETNALGTLNVLEGARASGRRPALVFTSTNKVYGAMEDVEVVEQDSRYVYANRAEGITESQPLDFHSPYGCSKGAGDQYVRDYARVYDLPTVVFRMSCIYGPRQFGTEDQGWLAHLIISAVTGRPITIYGDGKQVRDVLFVDDLVRALRLAVDRIGATAGRVYNIGGGVPNTLSVWCEFGSLLADLAGKSIPNTFGEWRRGDQRCYISNIGKAQRDLGWRPQIDKKTGIAMLWDWVCSNQALFQQPLVALRDEPHAARSIA